MAARIPTSKMVTISSTIEKPRASLPLLTNPIHIKCHLNTTSCNLLSTSWAGIYSAKSSPVGKARIRPSQRVSKDGR